MSAAPPKVPMRLSFMISSLRSRVAAAAERVEGVGEAVLVERPGGEGQRRDGDGGGDEAAEAEQEGEGEGGGADAADHAPCDREHPRHPREIRQGMRVVFPGKRGEPAGACRTAGTAPFR